MNASNNNFVNIASYSDRLQANLVVSLLEGSGFHVMTRSDDAGGLYNGLTAASGIYIYVLKDEATAALALLKSEGL